MIIVKCKLGFHVFVCTFDHEIFSVRLSSFNSYLCALFPTVSYYYYYYYRFGTVAGLNRNEASSDEEEGQAFYAGGSEHSGQQVIGPGKKKKDIVSEMFKSVKE